MGSWNSSKQDTTADLTMKAEYITTTKATKEGVWIKKFIKDLRVVFSSIELIPIYYDNNGAISQAKEPRSHQKHFEEVLAY